MIKKVFLFLSLFTSMIGFGQPQSSVEMADAFRADGKIYVVVGVVLIILLGLFAYLFYIDKKLSKIEKNQQ
jgi:CcmD family protein